MNNREKLMACMQAHALERLDVAELVHVDRATVDRWLLSGESARHEAIPDMAIELLRLKLGDNDPQAT